MLSLLLITPIQFVWSFLFLFRMAHVPVVRKRRLCPSAAACQRRRSAALPGVSTPWCVCNCLTFCRITLTWCTLNIYGLTHASMCSCSNTQESLLLCFGALWVTDTFIFFFFAGWRQWAEKDPPQLPCLSAILPLGCRPAGSVLGTVQERIGQSSDLSQLYTWGGFEQQQMQHQSAGPGFPSINDLSSSEALEKFTTFKHTEGSSYFALCGIWRGLLCITNSRSGLAVTRKPSAPVEFMSRFRRTVHFPSSMESCMRAWTWWLTLLKWQTFGLLDWGTEKNKTHN